jgi:hypothetical protein
MQIRDITNEYALLKSYKAVFVDSQKVELLKLYHQNKRRFPVFGARVYTPAGAAPAATPVALIDYRMRENLDDASPGRLFILERIDNPSDKGRTRLFWVWVSPALVAQMTAPGTTGEVPVKAHVLFHPFGNLHEYPAYWQGGIDPLRIPNFLELGARYLCKEKQTVAQHFCAARPGGTAPGADGFAEKKCPWAMMVVVPVSSSASFTSLGDPAELQDALEEIARRCHEGVTGKVVAGRPVKLQRVAVSGYSRSGAVLQALMSHAGRGSRFMDTLLKEVYAFDVMLDEKGGKDKAPVSKKQGYERFWGRLKTWQGDDSDRRIRLYSAEPDTVGGIYAELKERLKRYGGGYDRAGVPFSGFNGKAMPGGKQTYAGLMDGFEIYSTDNSRSLVVLPSGNAEVYLSSEKLGNPRGFGFGGDYEPGLEGHSWFVSRLQSHALFHSGF